MSSLNQAQIIGRLGGDPEVKYLPGGDAVANFTVATSERWKDKASGENREATEWHRIVIFGKLAEICGEYLRKGSQVFLQGKIKTRKWQDKDGNDRYTTELHCSTMTMLGNAATGDAGGGRDTNTGASRPTNQRQATPPQSGRAAPTPPAAGGKQGGFDDFDDDIPF